MRRLPQTRVLAAAGLAGALALGLASLPATASAAPRASVGGPTLDLGGVQYRAAEGRSPKAPPKVSGKSWVIADADTGAILAANNAHAQRLPASTLKTLTAVTLLDELDPEKVYKVAHEDVAVDGSRVGITVGSSYTIDQLWYGLFLASGNDTAHALARANGGMKSTVEQMNAKAAQLQAVDTVAKNTSGLDAKGQVSSSYDLALIARAGLKMPAFAKYASTVKKSFPASGSMTKKKRKSFMVYNHNPLLLGQYPGAIGVKTGYTDAARRTFVGAAKHGDRTLIVTIMGYEGNTYRTAEALLDWGFANQKKVAPVGQLVDPLPDVPATTQAENKDDSAKDEGKPAAAENVSTNGGGSPPLWPFLLVGAGLLGVVAWSMFGNRRSNDPLAAANKGLGGSHRPRGRGGPGNY